MAPSNKLKLANDGDKVELVKVKNNEDDSKTTFDPTKQLQTYGFAKMIEGIANSYALKEKQYFNITINKK
jgi:hypothetical protein